MNPLVEMLYTLWSIVLRWGIVKILRCEALRYDEALWKYYVVKHCVTVRRCNTTLWSIALPWGVVKYYVVKHYGNITLLWSIAKKLRYENITLRRGVVKILRCEALRYCEVLRRYYVVKHCVTAKHCEILRGEALRYCEALWSYDWGASV